MARVGQLADCLWLAAMVVACSAGGGGTNPQSDGGAAGALGGLGGAPSGGTGGMPAGGSGGAQLGGTGGLVTGGTGGLVTGGTGGLVTGGTGGLVTGGTGGLVTGGTGGDTGGTGGMVTGGTGGLVTGGTGGDTGGTGGLVTGGTGGDTGGTGGTGGGDPFAATVAPTQAGSIWRFTFGNVVFEVDASVAGKIVTYSIGGTDVIVDSATNTGSVFWTSPQSDWNWPPPAEMDSSAYSATSGSNVVTMTGPAWGGGLAISKRFWANESNQVVTIEYTIHNGTGGAVSKAPWEITRVFPGGLTFFPNAAAPSALGSFPAVPLIANPATLPGALFLQYQTSQITADMKSGADGAEGWAAHVHCGTGLERTCTNSPISIKQWADSTAPAPSERENELFAAGSHAYVEFEQQGNYQSIPSGGTLVWTMHWYLRYLPAGILPTPGDALLTWVRGQLL